MPTKRLPQRPDLAHLKYQARDLLAGRLAAKPDSCLVCSGSVPRECGVQIPLIRLLVGYGADAEGRHIALALACQHGKIEVVRLLPDAAEDPNRYNPVGFHAHSTPLHQAALAGTSRLCACW
jgi:hypothetical protein